MYYTCLKQFHKVTCRLILSEISENQLSDSEYDAEFNNLLRARKLIFIHCKSSKMFISDIKCLENDYNNAM